MRVSFIVPTLKRPEFLRRCLASIQEQTVTPTEVLVGVRSDDIESANVISDLQDRLPIKSVEAGGVGVIGSMSSCLERALGDFVALVDDDVELPPYWLSAMLGHLEQNTDVLAASGRDFLQDHPEMRRTERRVAEVGRAHWYGRMTGNHHRGAGKPRRVDILRGSNCLFRGQFLREARFEQRLRGKGAQVNWELALAFQAMQRKMRFYYDPTVEVLHHVAPRMDSDSLHRGGFNAEATFDSAFNETYVCARYAPGFRRWTALIYQAAVGSPHGPGIVHLFRQILRMDPHAARRISATVRGRWSAIAARGAQ